MSTAIATRRRGCETPRIWTKPLRKLTPETSHGWACIAFAEDVLGLTLMPWQKWLLIHALELLATGTYRFRTVLVLVARQNGKTLIMLVLALWHVYALESRTVIGTAQDLANAEKAWAEAVEMARAEPELEELIEDVKLGHPKQFLVRPNPEKARKLAEYRVAAASRRGARGFSGDLVLLDELREHASWDSWSAATKTTLARPKSQVWAFSNAGDAMSVVLRYLRASAHQALGWPDGDGDKDILAASSEDFEAWEAELEDGEGLEDSLGLFEWSAHPDAARTDRDAWAQANPSMNWDDLVEYCITERAIAAALRTDPPSVFDVEVLCRWTANDSSGPFPAGTWLATEGEPDDRFAAGSKRVIAVDVSWSRASTYVARAGFTDDGVPMGDIAADRHGTAWLVPWLVQHRDKYSAIVLQTNGAPVSSLLDEIEGAPTATNVAGQLVYPELDGKPLPVLKHAGADLGAATGLVFDRLASSTADKPRIKHLPHPGLDDAALTAVPKILSQGSWVIDRVRSPSDAAPLIAWIEAIWGLLQQTDTETETDVWGFFE